MVHAARSVTSSLITAGAASTSSSARLLQLVEHRLDLDRVAAGQRLAGLLVLRRHELTVWSGSSPAYETSAGRGCWAPHTSLSYDEDPVLRGLHVRRRLEGGLLLWRAGLLHRGEVEVVLLEDRVTGRALGLDLELPVGLDLVGRGVDAPSPNAVTPPSTARNAAGSVSSNGSSRGSAQLDRLVAVGALSGSRRGRAAVDGRVRFVVVVVAAASGDDDDRRRHGSEPGPSCQV